jgi:hypothetical protein
MHSSLRIYCKLSICTIYNTIWLYIELSISSSNPPLPRLYIADTLSPSLTLLLPHRVIINIALIAALLLLPLAPAVTVTPSSSCCCCGCHHVATAVVGCPSLFLSCGGCRCSCPRCSGCRRVTWAREGAHGCYLVVIILVCKRS